MASKWPLSSHLASDLNSVTSITYLLPQVLQGQAALWRDLHHRRDRRRQLRLGGLRGEVSLVVHAPLPAERRTLRPRSLLSVTKKNTVTGL